MPTARLRTVSREKNEMYIQRISAINMKVPFRSLSEQAEETVLIDSGATENFLDKATWERMGIGSHETAKPITVYNVDGTETVRVKSPITVGSEFSMWENRSSNNFILCRWEKRVSSWDTPFFMFSTRPLTGSKEGCQKSCTYKRLDISIASEMSWIFKGGR